ncbi:hypothetical protein ACM01_28655 [Streptomyces viridochromogenes]|uniref:Nephrocystin 3-like N-terminal domain-containing protein n=1 Tax=Streptomyces viridochromogenes TaxID=1938 RepID=A0A0J7Z5P3_STRVR|nr:hypothetical protein [Streptomyces viridochromogenes]KMS71094.1 hypothetical protein ACM01_28655 [Streptomyces viridochromogenes]KOG08381.1 hypothetical protein ADK36_42930 [Streptomyces viridochromogenes]KOG28699.1 hypothetical protein ADK35_03330 [Streptomyces viridochromogenes]
MATDEREYEVDVRGARGVQIGDGNIQFNVTAPAVPPARSAYLYQVQAIAPEALIGREEELEALAVFCTRPGGGDYQWWRAEAWAGKSALMSWFVLHPPAGVRIVSFFITARLAAQNDREAFLDVVIEQLASLLGEPLSPFMTAATRAAHFWRLLDAVAVACSEQGQRFVLVVDGLDEDSGSATHSIAALLPARPPAGMRVVVAGRHHPPVPSDVPTGHPLCDPAVERTLAVSPHAQVVRHDAERELKRLLRGTASEQDLLGFVTAAGGGLSSRDLAELTHSQAWEVEEALHAVTGRTFARRPASDWTEPANDVYMLGHEELQQTAARFLGDTRLAQYRQRLHTWAEQYHANNWPAESPEYLMRGYFRMLHADGDLPRMISCALDTPRHDRMLYVNGGDSIALNEIITTQDAILDREAPDHLRAMTLLAVCRDRLAQRNTHIPVGLPAVWALLGRPLRAEALARSIPDPGSRVRALDALIRAQAKRSTPDRAQPGTHMAAPFGEALAYEAASAARTIISPFERALALSMVAESAAQLGNVPHGDVLAREAAAVAQAIANPRARVRALLAVAKAVARAGYVGLAEALARTITNPRERARVLGVVASVRIGDADSPEVADHASTLPYQAAETAEGGPEALDRAEAEAKANTDPSHKASALVAAAEVAVRVGDVDRAEALAHEAEATARSIGDPSELMTAVEAVARAGDSERAEALARTITEPGLRIQALAAVAEAAARAGDSERAEAVARTITEPGLRIQALVAVAEAAARAGDVDRAIALAHEAQATARNISDFPEQVKVTAAVAVVMARSGNTERAEALARSIHAPYQRASTLAAVARVGDVDRTAALLAEAGDAARAVTNPKSRDLALGAVVKAVARAGDADLAEALARNITNAHERSSVLASLRAAAVIAARAEDADRAEALARTIIELGPRVRALMAVAATVARAGDADRAEALTREAEADALAITDLGPKTRALETVAVALARAGDADRAEALTREAEAAVAKPRVRSRVRTRVEGAPVRARVAAAVAQAGDVDRAEALTRTIINPRERAGALVAVSRQAEADHACSLIMQALRLDSWQVAANALAAQFPEVLMMVADELLAGQPATLPG